MASPPPNPSRFITRRPALAYFLLTFAISWAGALALILPTLLRHQPNSAAAGIRMFPVMLLGPSVAGLILTRLTDGATGLRNLFARISLVGVSLRWYSVLLIPPFLVLAVLLFLKTFVSPAYAPNFFLLGVLFGIPAGFLEEIGWTGYAFPKMRSATNALGPAILLGLLWSLWHLPVIDHLGAAAPHGPYLLRFFLAFTLAMTAMRVLISWLYANTNSLLLAQFLHASSTGSLVVFAAPHLTPGQESFWYALYGIFLWLVVAIVSVISGRQLKR